MLMPHETPSTSVPVGWICLGLSALALTGMAVGCGDGTQTNQTGATSTSSSGTSGEGGSGGSAGHGAGGAGGAGGMAGMGGMGMGGAGGMQCVPESGAPCMVAEAQGACALSITGCNGDCPPMVSPSTETCNQVDDDCDGTVDEGCVSQACQDNGRIWYFGLNAGLDFNGGEPVAINGPLASGEGSSVLSCNGKARMSTNGATVYDGNGNVMPNGNGLSGEDSATDSGTFVPRPESEEVFVFSVTQYESGLGPLHYSVIDKTANNGLGDVDPARKNLALQPGITITEKLTTIRHADGKSTWVLVHEHATDQFVSYRVSAAGLDPNPVSTAIEPVYQFADLWGQLSPSPDGTLLASSGAPIYLYDFDRSTGVVSNPRPFGSPCSQTYGLEFSPNGKVLYANCYSPAGVYQFSLDNLDPVAIKASQLKLGDLGPGLASGGKLRRGPNGKIYATAYTASALGVINQPNLLGTACDYKPQALPILGMGSYCLPNILHGSY